MPYRYPPPEEQGVRHHPLFRATANGSPRNWRWRCTNDSFCCAACSGVIFSPSHCPAQAIVDFRILEINSEVLKVSRCGQMSAFFFLNMVLRGSNGILLRKDQTASSNLGESRRNDVDRSLRCLFARWWKLGILLYWRRNQRPLRCARCSEHSF